MKLRRQAHLVHGEHDGCAEKRQYIVDEAEHENRRKDHLLLVRVGEVDDDELEKTDATGNMSQDDCHLSHKVARQKLKIPHADGGRQKNPHAGCRTDQVNPGNHDLGNSDLRRREDELLAEEMHRLAHKKAEDQVEDSYAREQGSEEPDVVEGHFGQKFRGKFRRGDKEDDAAKAHGTDPESDREHENKMQNLMDGEAPDRIKSETHACSAQKSAEVITHGLPHERHKADPAQGQCLMDGFQSQQSYPIRIK